MRSLAMVVVVVVIVVACEVKGKMQNNILLVIDMNALTFCFSS